MAYSYKTSISFGLVYIPIKLHSAVKIDDIGFNMIDKQTMSRIKYKKTCVDCDGREVQNEDIVKGYQYEKDKYVIFEDEDFEKIKTKKERKITIENFVNLEEVDPIYFEKSYYIEPIGGENAFNLLLKVMEEKSKVAIAKTILGTKETLIALRVKDGQLLLNTLYFARDIQSNPVSKHDLEVNDNELKLAEQIVEGMTSKFEPQKYKNEYKEKLQKAIETKIAGKEITVTKEKSEPEIINLVEALEKSLNIQKKYKKAQ